MPDPIFPAWSARFALPIEPHPKRRHRTRVVVPKAAPPFAQEYPDPAGVREEQALAAAARLHAPATPWAGPVVLSLSFVSGVPTSWAAWQREAALAGRLQPTGRPDVDNLAKGLMDAFIGSWWIDDAQVVRLDARKFYGPRAGILVEVAFLREVTREEWAAIKGGRQTEMFRS